MGDGVFWQAPLYPYFLAIVYKLFGHDYYLIRTIQFIIGSLNCLLLYVVTKKIFNSLIAFFSSIILSIYPVMIYFEGELLSPVVAISLDLLILLVLYEAVRRKRRSLWFLAGLLLGASALTCQNILLFVPGVIIWIFWTTSEKRVSVSLVFLLGILLLVIPVTLRNYLVGKDLVFISSNGGINFFIGNNPQYDQTVGIRPGIRWEHLTTQPERELGRLLKPSEEERYWYRKGFDFIVGSPMAYLSLLTKKFNLFWNGYEIKRNVCFYSFREEFSNLLKILIIDFRIIAPFALVGMFWGLKRFKRYSLFYLFITSYMLSVILFFVTSRYRLPVVPILIPFALYGAYTVFSTIKNGRYKAFLSSFILLAILSIWVNLDFGFDRLRDKADFHYQLGYAYHKRGEYKKAVSEYKMTISLNPENSDARNRLGILYERMGLYKLAIAELEEGLDYFPKDEVILTNLGTMYMHLKDYDRALEKYREAIGVDNTYVGSYNGMARLYLERGEPRKAEEVTKFLLNHGIQNEETLCILGEIYLEMGMFDLSKKFLDDALRINAENPEVHYVLEKWYRKQGRIEEAQREHLLFIRSLISQQSH